MFPNMRVPMNATIDANMDGRSNVCICMPEIVNLCAVVLVKAIWLFTQIEAKELI